MKVQTQKGKFKKYLKSKRRKAMTSELNQDKVTHADIENFKHQKKNG